jgi:hypothetical protein
MADDNIGDLTPKANVAWDPSALPALATDELTKCHSTDPD